METDNYFLPLSAISLKKDVHTMETNATCFFCNSYTCPCIEDKIKARRLEFFRVWDTLKILPVYNST